jgi:hypothetical protein
VLIVRLFSSRTIKRCVFPGQNCTTVLTALFSVIKHEAPLRRSYRAIIIDTNTILFFVLTRAHRRCAGVS